MGGALSRRAAATRISGRLCGIRARARLGRAAARRLSDEGADRSRVLSKACADRRGARAARLAPPAALRCAVGGSSGTARSLDPASRRRRARALGRRGADRAPARVHVQLPDGGRPDAMIDAWIEWMAATRRSAMMLDSAWTWPLAETVHFAGLVLLAGTVGLFDLRILGLGRGIPPVAIHRLVPFGVLGFVLLVAPGALFVFGTPDQYFHNAAFRWK